MAVIGGSMTAMEDALNIRPGMLIRYDGTPQQLVERYPDGRKVMDEQTRMSIAMQANLQNQYMDNLLGLGNAYAYAKAKADAYRAPQEPTTADKLNAWYARLEERVAQIEADDAVMGKKETKRWMDELAAFKADLS